MKLRAPSCTLLLLALLALGTPAWAAKVKVCHVPPGNPANLHTITVSEDAVPAHLGHGDLLGDCSGYCDQLCDDGNPCTVDTCDVPTGACAFPPVACPDGQTCNTGTGSCESAETCPCTIIPEFNAQLAGANSCVVLGTSVVVSTSPVFDFNEYALSDGPELFPESVCGYVNNLTGNNEFKATTPEQAVICVQTVRDAAASRGLTCN